MGAGIILSAVQDSLAFKMIPQLTILVPALLGLKGVCSFSLVLVEKFV